MCVCVLYVRMCIDMDSKGNDKVDGGIMYEFLFLCALLYFLSFLPYAYITLVTRKKFVLIFVL